MTVSPPEKRPEDQPDDEPAAAAVEDSEDVTGHLFTGALREQPPS